MFSVESNHSGVVYTTHTTHYYSIQASRWMSSSSSQCCCSLQHSFTHTRTHTHTQEQISLCVDITSEKANPFNTAAAFLFEPHAITVVSVRNCKHVPISTLHKISQLRLVIVAWQVKQHQSKTFFYIHKTEGLPDIE